jgi:hypothetical protein
MEGERPGSPIWNYAWKNRELVQSQSFWELHDGQSTLFWEDAWEKRSTLSSDDQAPDHKRKNAKGWENESCSILGRSPTTRLGGFKILDPTRNLANRLERFPYASHEGSSERSSPPNRKGPDIIRWGKRGDGNFHIKESYQEAMAWIMRPRTHYGPRCGTPRYGRKWPPFFG